MNLKSLSLLLFLTIIFFQNCSGELQTLDEFKYGSEYAKSIIEQSELQTYWDSQYDPIKLRSEDEIIFDSQQDSLTKKIMFDEVTLFLVVTNRATTSAFSLVVDKDQILAVTIQSTKVAMKHESPAENSSQTYFTVESNEPLVVGIRSGRDPKNILIMVNGEYKTMAIQNKGIPLNFSYLESVIEVKNIQQALVINRAMEPGEINVLSRQLASEYGIPSKISKEMPDYLAWSKESKLFPEVRTLMKSSCFKCHNSWIGLSEAGFTTASKHTKNIQLVKPKNLSESILWHSLQGSSGISAMPATRDMPKDLPALTAAQIVLLKNWIMQIQ